MMVLFGSNLVGAVLADAMSFKGDNPNFREIGLIQSTLLYCYFDDIESKSIDSECLFDCEWVSVCVCVFVCVCVRE